MSQRGQIASPRSQSLKRSIQSTPVPSNKTWTKTQSSDLVTQPLLVTAYAILCLVKWLPNSDANHQDPQNVCTLELVYRLHSGKVLHQKMECIQV